MKGIYLGLYQMERQVGNFFLTRFFPQYLPQWLFSSLAIVQRTDNIFYLMFHIYEAFNFYHSFIKFQLILPVNFKHSFE